TSANHEWRAVQEFASAGLTVDPAPVNVWTPHTRGVIDYVPGPLALLHSSEALHEILGDRVRQMLALSQLRTQSP
ncbi:MAG: hypothetical protein ACRETG_08625, partial [Steroidobacteraceae bacterium]